MLLSSECVELDGELVIIGLDKRVLGVWLPPSPVLFEKSKYSPPPLNKFQLCLEALNISDPYLFAVGEAEECVFKHSLGAAVTAHLLSRFDDRLRFVQR